MDNEIVNLDQDRDDALAEIREIVLENNKILHGMRRMNRLSTVWHAIYWVVIIGIGFGSFLYLQPYIEKLTNAYNELQATQQKITDIPKGMSLDSLKSYFTGPNTGK